MLRLINWVMQVASGLTFAWVAWRIAQGKDAVTQFWIVAALTVLSFATQILVFRQKRDQDAKAAELPPGRLQ